MALLKGEGEGCEVFHYHLDHLGTPMELIDEQGDSVWQALYRSYGEVLELPVSTINNPLRFQGQYYDVETELYYIHVLRIG